MDESGFATVALRVKLKGTVGDFKEQVAEEAHNLFYNDKKLENDEDKLKDVGVGPESFVCNSQISKSNKLFFDRLSSSSVVKFIYGILSVVRIPKIRENPNRSHILFSIPIRPSLEAIINELDVLSFLRFISTCKWLHSFSVSCETIRIKFESEIEVQVIQRGEEYFTRIRLLFEDLNGGQRTVTGVLLENLQKLPLEICTTLNFDGDLLTSSTMAKVSEYFAKFKSIKILELNVPENMNVVCWQELIDFIKSYTVYELVLDCPNTMSEEQYETILLMDLDDMLLRGRIPRNVFHRMVQQKFYLMESGLTVEDFKEILKHLTADRLDVASWTFDDIHTDFADPETFRRCFEDIEELPIDYKGKIPKTRPLISYEVTDEGETKVYLLTGRNIIFGIFLYEGRDRINIYYENWLVFYTGPNMFRKFVGWFQG